MKALLVSIKRYFNRQCQKCGTGLIDVGTGRFCPFCNTHLEGVKTGRIQSIHPNYAHLPVVTTTRHFKEWDRLNFNVIKYREDRPLQREMFLPADKVDYIMHIDWSEAESKLRACNES